MVHRSAINSKKRAITGIDSLNTSKIMVDAMKNQNQVVIIPSIPEVRVWE